MALPHTRIFHPRAITRHLAIHAFPSDMTTRHERFVLPWVKRLRSGDLDEVKERSLQGPFLLGFFGGALGYRAFADSGEAEWELTAEKTVSKSGKSVDGALGFFGSGGESKVIAPIELKGAKQSLDVALGRTLTPIQQAWEYADFSPGCRWIIVSNCREIRLYSRLRTPAEYEVFKLEDLADLETFKRLYLLLSREQLLPRIANEQAPLDELLVASDKVQAEITAELYREYRDLRTALFTHICQVHSNQNPLDLLKHTQTILDRILFIAFAEDRGLIPQNTLSDAISYRNKYNPRPIWQNFVTIFRWLDQGNDAQKVPAYNGGLFAPNHDVEELDVSDEMCKKLGDLARFDYYDDVSVEVLGHIFEQSITDLEEMRAEAGGEALRISKRKTEGVYYTPAYITRYIVDETLGRVLMEKWESAFSIENPDTEKKKAVRERKEIAAWERYRDMLKETRVIDPACGSGAFLVAAFDVLAREYERVNAALATLRSGQVGLFDLNQTILNSNLFGVDLNDESVAITKLSLWLKTCSRGAKLTYLDRNIKCGNSIVADPMYDPRDEHAPRAFDWSTGNLVRSFITPSSTPEVDAEIDARWRNGFDAVVGNPPYVRQELLTRIKPYLQREYRVYHGTADLYLYFYELGLRLLRTNGRLGYISSGTFTRANFAREFRRLLPNEARLESYVDFGENQPFEEAEMVRPSIVVVKKAPPSESFRYLFLGGAIPESLDSEMQRNGMECKSTLLQQPEWAFQSNASAVLINKIQSSGTPLASPARNIYRGILTGLNEVFIIDSATRDRLILADSATRPVFKCMLRGEDLRPWYQEDEGRYAIVLPSGWTRQTFGPVKSEAEAWNAFTQKHPALTAHLAPFANAAQKRHDRGEYWWELRSCAYYTEFDKPKIFWPNIAKLPRFSWDTAGKFSNDKGYILPTNDLSLLAILQSRVTWFVVSRLCTPLRLRAGLWQYQMFVQFIERLPIPDMTADERSALAALAERITTSANSRYALHQKMLNRMRDLVPQGKSLNRKLTEWWRLDFASLRAELKKTYKQDITLRERDDWETLWKERCLQHARATADIVANETEMNERVYRLFALATDEIRLIEEETKYSYGEV
jgi:hypothetical protein